MNQSHSLAPECSDYKSRQRERDRRAIVALIASERKKKADECVRRWAERAQDVLDK